MELLCLVSLVILLLNGTVLWWISRKKGRPTHCPECGSAQIGRTSHDPIGMRNADISGSSGGGYATNQIDYTTTYRCNACRHGWTQTETVTL